MHRGAALVPGLSQSHECAGRRGRGLGARGISLGAWAAAEGSLLPHWRGAGRKPLSPEWAEAQRSQSL